MFLRNTMTTAVVLLACVYTHAKRGGISGPQGKTRRVGKILWARPCPNEPQNSLHCYDVQQHEEPDGSAYLDADCYVTRGAISWNRLEIKSVYCDEKMTPESCKMFQNWKFQSNVCGIVTDPNAFWATFVYRLQPAVTCPFTSGNYSCKGVKVDPRRFSFLPFDNLKAKITLFDQHGLLHACIEVAVAFIREKLNN